MKKMKVLLLVALSAACILSGCSKPEEAPVPPEGRSELLPEVLPDVVLEELPAFPEVLPVVLPEPVLVPLPVPVLPEAVRLPAEPAAADPLRTDSVRSCRLRPVPC